MLAPNQGNPQTSHSKWVRKLSRLDWKNCLKYLKNYYSTVYTDGWKAYDALILNGYDHYRVFHSRDEFARGKCHVNGIESFWSFAKRRLAKFNGLTDKNFLLHLKECQFRFNYRDQKDFLQHLWKMWKN
ncbi:MAG: IS1595 family transposase [Alphaproteobacteria bacterium]